jgi:hypothetical protein
MHGGRPEGSRLSRAAPAGGGRQDLPDQHRRPQRRRPDRARPDGRPLAGTLCRRRGDADGVSRLSLARPSRSANATPLAVLDAPASGRMAVGEALTNIAAADIATLGEVKLSANWMAAAGFPRRGCAPVRHGTGGVRSLPEDWRVDPGRQGFLSMRTTWQEATDGDGTRQKQVVSPLSLIVTGFAPSRMPAVH